ncbi:MAG TPA: xylose isomerase, partial [Opitutaceae bacterium]
VLQEFVDNRYASYDEGFGKDIEKRKIGFKELERLVLGKLGEPTLRSGKQEYLENLVNQYVIRGA